MARMFNFAWVDDTETTFDDVAHVREDLQVFSFSFEHNEGDFAALSITFINPRVGLLNPTRKRWIWFSALIGGVQTPLFFGRIVGIPNKMFQETITVDFQARPQDFVDRKIAIANTMRDAPWWDPLFVNADALNDPDTVLEARPEMWHIDPVTHDVTSSDILVGEDGVEEFTTADYFDDEMDLSIGQTPARSVLVRANVAWDNQGAGFLDLTGLITNYTGVISSFTYQGLFNDWPKPKTNLQSGWYVQDSRLIDLTGQIATQQPPPISLGYDWRWLRNQWPTNLPFGSMVLLGPSFGQSEGLTPYQITLDHWNSALTEPTKASFLPMGTASVFFRLGYYASRQYTEHVQLLMTSDTQDVVTLPGDDESLILDITSNKASDIINGVIPIGDVGRRSFFATDLGESSLQHLLLIGRAALLMRSRNVTVTFTTTFAAGVPCTLRKNALIHNPRLPGGQALGKITSVKHALDGEEGTLLSTVTIACAIGRGGDAYEEVLGDPTYVEEGYFDPGEVQVYENSVRVIPSSDISYTMEHYEPNDDGIDFTKTLSREDAVRLFNIDNPVEEQRVLIGGSGVLSGGGGPPLSLTFDESVVKGILQKYPTVVNLELVPLDTGPFDTDVFVTITDLRIPRQINLEAEA